MPNCFLPGLHEPKREITISQAWSMKDEAEIEIRSIINRLKQNLSDHSIKVIPEINHFEDSLDMYYDFKIKLIIK